MRRKEVVKPERVVSGQVIDLVQKAFFDWLWQAYRGRKLPVGDIAAEVGLTRQGLTKVLKRESKKMQFATFLQACFVRPGVDSGITIAAEGWKIELRWAIERSNGSCLSNGEARA